MNRSVTRLLELALTAIGIATAATAYAIDISGTVPATGLVITNNSKLVGDVDCTSVTDGVACITFGAPNITLKLNGFTMTGKADEVCTGPNGFNGTGGFVTGEAGISTGGYSNVSVVGPGVIRFFRENGITTFVDLNTMSTNVVIKLVTLSRNCVCGISIFGSLSDLEKNTVVSNGRCGIGVSGNSNLLARNESIGNAGDGIRITSAESLPPTLTSNDNTLEENNCSGNDGSGIVIFPANSGNLVRRNIVLGNPPIGFIIVNPSHLPHDITDSNAIGANTYQDNLCQVGAGGAANACPNTPKFSGHCNPLLSNC